MFRAAALAIALTLAPLAVQAQTQSRDGLGSGSGSQTAAPSNSLPAGAINAQTGPQSRPAYGSGLSTTPNPGEAFVRTTPVPSTGPAQSPPGTLSTTTVGGSGTATTTGGPGVGEAARPPR